MSKHSEAVSEIKRLLDEIMLESPEQIDRIFEISGALGRIEAQYFLASLNREEQPAA